MSDFERVDLDDVGREFSRPQNNMGTEPVPFSDLSLSLEHVNRASSRGLLLLSSDKKPDGDPSTVETLIEIIPGTIADRVSDYVTQLSPEAPEVAGNVWDSFFRDAFHEENDKYFGIRWLDFI